MPPTLSPSASSLLMLLRKPLIALPRSLPILRRRDVPKSMTTIARDQELPDADSAQAHSPPCKASSEAALWPFRAAFSANPDSPMACQYLEDIGMVEAKVCKHHHGVKPQIGYLVLASSRCSPQHLWPPGSPRSLLHRLFRGSCSGPSVQCGDIRTLRRRGFTFRQHFVERRQ